VKKIICIYLMFVMILTGCGRKKITSRDTPLPAVKAVLPQESIEDFYRRQLEEITDPALNVGDEKAEPTLTDTAKKYLYNTRNFLYEHKVAICATAATAVTTAVCFWQRHAIANAIAGMLHLLDHRQQGQRIRHQADIDRHQDDINRLLQNINQYQRNLQQELNLPQQQNLARLYEHAQDQLKYIDRQQQLLDNQNQYLEPRLPLHALDQQGRQLVQQRQQVAQMGQQMGHQLGQLGHQLEIHIIGQVQHLGHRLVAQGQDLIANFA
jgi:hypothetical protein